VEATFFVLRGAGIAGRFVGGVLGSGHALPGCLLAFYAASGLPEVGPGWVASQAVSW
jgi:hypothetical protein